MPRQTANRLAEKLYERIKAEIADFRLLPGDRLTETALAEQYNVSRTPIRDALYRLRSEGYVDVAFRSGWTISPFDFARFDDFYDLRIILECAAVERLCQTEFGRTDLGPAEVDVALDELREIWLAPPAGRETDPRQNADLDEQFHCRLVGAAGNAEMARVHLHVTERIRTVRRLDFLRRERVAATYEEHAEILRLVLRRRAAEANLALRAHITQSKQEVRKITIHMLHEARATNSAAAPEFVNASD
jgi:DNA-binding GntR family transcriptional regulator